MRIAFAIIFAMILSSCATSSRYTEIQMAEIAIAEKRWSDAYHFLEISVIVASPETKEKALELYRSKPQIGLAAAKAFSKSALNHKIRNDGFETAKRTTKNDLQKYAFFASNDDLRVASENYQAVIVAIEERVAKLNEEYFSSQKDAVFHCQNKSQCEKAFALAQIFIATNTDMKIQMANDTIIETYNPVKAGAMGANAMKIPRSAETADILLTVTCKSETPDDLNLCKVDSIRINRAFPSFIREKLVD